jgi:hypothetical protein
VAAAIAVRGRHACRGMRRSLPLADEFEMRKGRGAKKDHPASTPVCRSSPSIPRHASWSTERVKSGVNASWSGKPINPAVARAGRSNPSMQRECQLIEGCPSTRADHPAEGRCDPQRVPGLLRPDALEIPPSVTGVGFGAFRGCSEDRGLGIPGLCRAAAVDSRVGLGDRGGRGSSGPNGRQRPSADGRFSCVKPEPSGKAVRLLCWDRSIVTCAEVRRGSHFSPRASGVRIGPQGVRPLRGGTGGPPG